jgi:antitoxin PrlF
MTKTRHLRQQDSYVACIEDMMIVSKLTTKAQTTIPQPVRAALRLQAGDELMYEINDQRVILTKAARGGKTDDPFRAFHEWSSEADAMAYGKL